LPFLPPSVSLRRSANPRELFTREHIYNPSPTKSCDHRHYTCRVADYFSNYTSLSTERIRSHYLNETIGYVTGTDSDQ